MKTNYPFLQKWKQAEKKNSRPINRTNIMIMGGAPLSGAQPPPKSQFTGYGEDGQLQPENPVEMVNTEQGQKLIHEGEVKVSYPDGTTTVIPAKDLPQDKLRKMQEKGMQGLQAGGSFRQAQPSVPGKKFTPEIKNPLISNPQQGIYGKPTAPLGATGQFKQQTPDLTVNPQGIGPIPDPLTSPDIVSPQNITSPTFPLQQQTLPNIPQQNFPLTPTTLPNIPGENVLGQAQPGPDFQKSAVAPVGAQGQFPFAKDVPQAKQIGDPVAPIKPDIGEPPLTEDELKYQQTLQKLTKLSEGESELDKKIREEERARFKGEEQAGKGALEQQLSQLGLTGREALLERAMAGRGFAQQEAEVISNLRKGQADRAFQASMALPGATLAGMKFNMEKDQWQKMFDFGKEKWDYGTKLDLVNSLIQQGGAENYQQASELLNGMFGTSVDFSNALNAENQQNFFSGMDIMSSSLASGLSWEETMKALEQGGLLDKMGMTESDVKGMYENMKLQSDPLYQAQKLTDQWVEQGIMTQDEADDYMAMIKYGISNPEGFDISDGFAVYDDKGNEMGFFKTQEEADEFMKDHPDWKSEFMENHVQPKDSGPGGGDGDDPGPSDGTSGDPLAPYTTEEWDDMSSNEQHELFLETVPPEFQDEWGYNRWKKDGGFQTFDGYQKHVSDNPPDPTSFLDRVKDEGWSTEIADLGLDRDTRTKLKEVREKFLEGEAPPALSFEDIIENGDTSRIFAPLSAGTVVFFGGQDHPAMQMGLSFVTDPETNYIAREVSFMDIDTGKITKYYVTDKLDGGIANIVPSDGTWEFTPG